MAVNRTPVLKRCRSLDLDPTYLGRSDLWAIIRALRGRVTVVLTTHYMEEAAALSDRIGIMQDGRLQAVGTVDELKARTQTTTLEEAFIRIVKEGV